MNALEVGERIAALRREKGLTQKELAERIYVTDKAVYTLRTVRRQLRRASEKQPSAPDRSV